MSDEKTLKERTPNYYVYGGFLGMALGVVTSHLYKRRRQQLRKEGGDPNPTIGELVTLVSLTAGFVNQIASVGLDKDEKDSKDGSA